MLILIYVLCPVEEYYGFIGFAAWTLGWLIASQKNVRLWSFWRKGAVLAITIPVFVVVLFLFLSSLLCRWCINPEGEVDLEVTPVLPHRTEEVTGMVTTTPTITPIVTPTPTPEPTEISAPADGFSIAIVDLMMVPRSRFGDQSPRFEVWNEYVEIYNYGESDVDLDGLWLTDGGGAGQPDQIVTWDSRFDWYEFQSNVSTSTMILPPGEFGLILPGRYVLGDTPHNDLIEQYMRTSSVILTIAENDSPDLIGDLDGLECHTPGSEDFVVIYRGTEARIDSIVASYGRADNFKPGMHPSELTPTLSGAFPVTCGTWGGVRSDPFIGDMLVEYWLFYPWAVRSPGYE